MHTSHRFGWLLAVVVPVLLATLLLAQPGSKGTQYAFLVACSGYDQNELKRLPYTIKEMEEFREALLASGYDAANVKLLHDKQSDRRYLPEKVKILRQLDLLLARINPEDSLLVAFNGHGVQFIGDKSGYFCPIDASLEDKNTLLPTEGEDGLFERLKKCKAKRKLLIVNACRNDPSSERAQAARKINLEDRDDDLIPEGIAALYSCKAGQKSYYYDPEDAKSKGRERSLFFHHVIQSWKGAYGNADKLTVEDFFRLVREKTAADADNLFDRAQTPVVRREYIGEGEWLLRGQSKRRDRVIATRYQSMNLKVRRASEYKFTNDTMKLGIEACSDDSSGNLLYISERGSIAVVPNGEGARPEIAKPSRWSYGMNVKARKASEYDFTKDTMKFGIEAYWDEESGNLLYVSEKGAIAALSKGKGVERRESGVKPPTWIHGMNVKVRKASEYDFTKDTMKFGIEAYWDEESENLLYVSEKGMITALMKSEKVKTAEKVKPPTWSHGMKVAVRKMSENDSIEKMIYLGIEAFWDENSENFLYVSETGSIAAVPYVSGNKPPELKPVDRLVPTSQAHRIVLTHTPGRDDGDREGARYNIEVYKDDVTGNTLYVCESGDIAVRGKTSP